MRSATVPTAQSKTPEHPAHAALALIPEKRPPRAALDLEITEAKRKLDALVRFRQDPDAFILPIERDSVLPATDHAIDALRTEQRRLEAVLQHPHYRPIEHAVLCEVLGWRNADGWPSLAPFSISSGLVQFQVRPPNTWNGENGMSRQVHPSLPHDIRSCYDDVFAALEKRRNLAQREITLSVRFTGAIPAEARDAIRKAQKHFSSIFVLAEVDRWAIEEREIPALGVDPLVLGWNGACWFLIAAFDCTPLEEAVRDLCTGARNKA
jgi:hypothetical protein